MTTDISEIIGWKFNHQQGMTTINGVITKFPGGIPSQADQDKWTAEYEAYLPTQQWQKTMAESDSSILSGLDVAPFFQPVTNLHAQIAPHARHLRRVDHAVAQMVVGI